MYRNEALVCEVAVLGRLDDDVMMMIVMLNSTFDSSS